MKYRFLEDNLVILHFLSWFILSYVIFYDIFVFFYFIQKKYIFIKYFFTINVPINYPPLSKKHIKLSKNCPFASKKIQKNQKNSEKIRFFYFFSYGLDDIFDKSCVSIYHLKIRKKCCKKKVEKKVIFIFANFFF